MCKELVLLTRKTNICVTNRILTVKILTKRCIMFFYLVHRAKKHQHCTKYLNENSLAFSTILCSSKRVL